MPLGQTGPDTTTHIVSLLSLLFLGMAVPGIIGYFQHGPLDDLVALGITGFESTVAVGLMYYATKFVSGVTSITTDPSVLQARLAQITGKVVTLT